MANAYSLNRLISVSAYYRTTGDNTLHEILIAGADISEENWLDLLRLDVSKSLTDEKLSSPILILINGGKS